MDLLDDFDGDDFVDSGGVATITKKDKMHSRKQGKCIAPPGSRHPRDELIEDLTNPDLGGSEGGGKSLSTFGCRDYGDVAYLGTKIENPAELSFPFTLPIEVALNEYPVSEICGAYNISMEQYALISKSDAFVAALESAKGMLAKEGMSFKVKAKLQAESLLTTSWGIIHDIRTPHNVRADLIKSTIRWAGYEAPDAQVGVGAGFSININFSREDTTSSHRSDRHDTRGILIDHE
jgi:hypothetical protein